MTYNKYRKNGKLTMVCIAAITAASVLAGCGTSAGTAAGNTESISSEAEAQTQDAVSDTTSGESADPDEAENTQTDDELFTERDLRQDYDETEAVAITLSDAGSTCEASSVKIDGSVITITEEGVYVVSGSLSDGQIIVETDDSSKVQIVLDGADITCSSSAAIYVKNADKVFLTTADGSENTLTVSGAYDESDENGVDAVVFSKDDLVLNGLGSLTVNAVYGHGVVSKDDLKVTGGTISISAEKCGLNANDSIRIAEGDIDIEAGTDALHSDAYIVIEDGSLSLEAGDDGIHADTDLTVDGGTVHVISSYEGLEGQTITINGGTIDVTASDDGFNAAGGTDSSQENGPMGGDMFAADENALITVNNGEVHVDAGGDGIDSNGSIVVTGGYLYVEGPQNDGNGTFDYNGTATISGGTVIALGSSGMAQNFSEDSTQGSMLVTLSAAQSGAVTLTDSEGNELVSVSSDKTFSCVLISCEEITEGSAYTLSAGNDTQTIEMTSLIYGQGSGMMGMGGQNGRNGFQGQPGDESAEGQGMRGNRDMQDTSGEAGFEEGDFGNMTPPEGDMGGGPGGMGPRG